MLFHNAPASYWVKQLSPTPQVPVESEADIRDRWYAVHALGQLGPDAAEALKPLEEILADKYEFEYIRGGAAWALGRIGQPARPAVPLLIDTLTSKHVSVRRNSPLALAAIGGDEAQKAITPIAKLLDDEDAGVQAAAALALWQLDRDPRAVPKLAEMLEKGKGEAPYQAAVALGQLGSDVGRIANPSGNPGDHPDGLPSRPKELFQDRSVATGKNAHPTAAVDWAFLPDGGSGGSETGSKGKPTALLPPILGALVGALHHADEDVRRAAARSLGEIGPPALPAIQKVLAGKDARTAREAAESLGYLGSAAIPALTAALRHADPQVRRIAARAWAGWGPRPSRPSLRWWKP